ncbi:hypothetical protein NQ314_013307 [Rhamnusium bicolor]|uniref:UDP-glucose 4-epimerase n=1 Tax=Rhamnusium bicolor TaxID=1586634 RepID=A0AAV8X7J4_9CUCU|nr:hypothetical protein NQ314_013307 [Rhamnusium bicolor]
MLNLVYKSSYAFVLFYYVIIPLGYLTKWWVTVEIEKMKCNSTILVTGGGGYVGSHTIVELLNNNYSVIVIDNLVNCYAVEDDMPEALKRVERLTKKSITFYNVDIGDREALDKIFKTHQIDSVIHFAALKAVGESVQIPLAYYQNNVGGSSILFEVMANNGVKSLVFSSSATVYGSPQFLPITEQHPTGQGCTNPYGRTKYFVEEILKDVCVSDPEWRVILLRYFNPVGAHESGLIGEDPSGIPNNLMPYISQVAVGRREKLLVFGSDYPTPDGTGVRDYIHITDLAIGHLKALQKNA